MKKLILPLLAVLGFAVVAWTAGVIWPVLTAEQEAEVKQKLDSFEKGTLSYDDLTQNAGKSDFDALLAYYFSHSNEVSLKAKLPIGRVFAYGGMFDEAVKLSTEYVQVYSNDWRGWRLLGGADMHLTNTEAAISAYTNAVRLGDNGSVVPLAALAWQMDRLDLVSNLVDKLLVIKQSKATVGNEPLDAVVALVLYSLKSGQKDIFVKALEGVSLATIKSRRDLQDNVALGLKGWGDEEIDKVRQRLQLSKEEVDRLYEAADFKTTTNVQNSGKSP